MTRSSARRASKALPNTTSFQVGIRSMNGKECGAWCPSLGIALPDIKESDITPSQRYAIFHSTPTCQFFDEVDEVDEISLHRVKRLLYSTILGAPICIDARLVHLSRVR